LDPIIQNIVEPDRLMHSATVSYNFVPHAKSTKASLYLTRLPAGSRVLKKMKDCSPSLYDRFI
jgi:hypothetical protein